MFFWPKQGPKTMTYHNALSPGKFQTKLLSLRADRASFISLCFIFYYTVQSMCTVRKSSAYGVQVWQLELKLNKL